MSSVPESLSLFAEGREGSSREGIKKKLIHFQRRCIETNQDTNNEHSAQERRLKPLDGYDLSHTLLLSRQNP